MAVGEEVERAAVAVVMRALARGDIVALFVAVVVLEEGVVHVRRRGARRD